MQYCLSRHFSCQSLRLLLERFQVLQETFVVGVGGVVVALADARSRSGGTLADERFSRRAAGVSLAHFLGAGGAGVRARRAGGALGGAGLA